MVFTLILQTLAYFGIISNVPTPPWGVDQAPASLPPFPNPPSELWGYANGIYEANVGHGLNVTNGRRVNVKVLGGNWTNPDGSLLAHILPGIGGDQGYKDAATFHQDIRQTMQFVSDNKYGYVRLKGYRSGVNVWVIITVETDSVANLKFNNRLLYSVAMFKGDTVMAPIWALGPSEHTPTL
ncbi:uncharacterized protein EI90DRAFT_3115336 [Cantharellus anzutake]|uniref:uncharacterized protein n=1 Tax=Cantharellus anzutake TaxID=1750568 RepID=UPI00190848EE|nr:uncharacterized protein EI90DRAFT_3115336 [Cantharellus anzutake]KAF8342791.1 hypothetical protein EI90DRAFT_3115336 [Cantharellus anzutake]